MPKKFKFLLLGVILLIFIYNLIGQISTTLKSEDRVSQGTEQLYELEKKNKELKKRLTEVKSQEFIEEQARDKLGLAREGETVVIIPEEKINQVLGSQKEEEKPKLPNWQGWLNLFWP